MDEHEPLRLLEAVCDGIVWPWPDIPPRDEAACRLLAFLGVKGVPAVTAVDAQALTSTRDCVAPLCVDVALPGLDHCRRHASIADIRMAREGTAGSSGRDALQRMDAGEPQRPAQITKEEPMAVTVALDPPHDWPIKVKGTGLRYRSVDEALVAAEEIEADGERVSRDARFDGNEAKADQAIDESRELGRKIRAGAEAFQSNGVALGGPEPGRGESRSEATPVTASEPSGPASAKSPKWTPEKAVAAIKAHHAEHGVVPIQRDATGNPNLPAAGTIGKWPQTWADLVEMAGFPRPKRGGAGRKGSGRAVAAVKAKPEKAPAAPAVEPTAAREPEPVPAGPARETDGELAARPDEPSEELALNEPPAERLGPDGGASLNADDERFSVSLALTGHFARDAERCRAEAELLRRQAAALDRIADGIDQLAAA